jgi:hypothetical protein
VRAVQTTSMYMLPLVARFVSPGITLRPTSLMKADRALTRLCTDNTESRIEAAARWAAAEPIKSESLKQERKV